jgi:hypothetical protein
VPRPVAPGPVAPVSGPLVPGPAASTPGPPPVPGRVAPARRPAAPARSPGAVRSPAAVRSRKPGACLPVPCPRRGPKVRAPVWPPGAPPMGAPPMGVPPPSEVRARPAAAVPVRGRAGRRLVVDHGPGLGGGQVGSGVAQREGRVPRLRLGLGGTPRPAGDAKPCGAHGGAVPRGELARRVDRVGLAGPRRVAADGAAPAAIPG